VRCAGLLHVGDRDQADLEALLGLLELAAERLQRRFGRGQRVLGREHVEVALRRAHHQVLLRCAVIGLGQRDLGVGAPQRLPLVPAEDGLRQPRRVIPVLVGIRLVAVADRNDLARRRVDLREIGFAIGFGRVGLAVQGNLREQQRARLGLGFERRQPAGLGLADQRIALDRGLVDVEQVLGLGERPEEGRGNAAGEQERFLAHALTLWRRRRL